MKYFRDLILDTGYQALSKYGSTQRLISGGSFEPDKGSLKSLPLKPPEGKE